jgi:MFS family permease
VTGASSRAFRLYFGARLVSLLGDAMLQVALAAAVLGAGYGFSGVGYALAAWTFPVALFVLLGGVLADRYRPLPLMIAADLVRMVVQSVFAAILLAGTPALWQILCLQAIAGLATAMFQPGVASLVPRVAGDVQRANGALRVAEALTVLVGPAVAGVLIAASGPGVVFAADAATFGLSALCLLGLRLPAAAATTATPALWRNLLDGWREFRSRAWLWAVIVLWAASGLTVLGPGLPLGASLIIAGHGSSTYGAVMSAFGGGTIVGGLLGFRLRPGRPLAAGAGGMFAFALCPLVLAAGLPAWLVAAGYAAGGAALGFWGVMWATTLQTQVPAAVLNRVSAYDVAGSVLVVPVGRALSGPVAGAVGAREVMLASACCAVAVSAAMLCVPAIRDLRRADP